MVWIVYTICVCLLLWNLILQCQVWNLKDMMTVMARDLAARDEAAVLRD